MSSDQTSVIAAEAQPELDRREPESTRLPRLSLATLLIAVGTIVFAAAAFTTSGFVTTANGKAILVSASVVGILAIGETAIMIGGNMFSLSLATTSAASAMLFFSVLKHGLAAAICVTLVFGIAVNALQGAIVGWWRANPIILTIAAGSLIEGAAITLTDGRNLYAPEGSTSYEFLIKTVGGIPVPVIVFLVFAVLAELVLRRSRFGAQLYLIGSNRRAARAAALPVGWVTTGAFALAGLAAAIAGMLLAAITTQAQASVAGTYTYDAIAAALVGGSAVFGGKGSFTRAVLGAIALAAMTDLALLRGYSTGLQIVVKGVLVLIAVVLVAAAGRRGSR